MTCPRCAEPIPLGALALLRSRVSLARERYWLSLLRPHSPARRDRLRRAYLDLACRLAREEQRQGPLPTVMVVGG